MESNDDDPQSRNASSFFSPLATLSHTSSWSGTTPDIESPKPKSNKTLQYPSPSSSSSEMDSPKPLNEKSRSSRSLSLLSRAFSFSSSRDIESPTNNNELGRDANNNYDDDNDASVSETVYSGSITARKHYCHKHPDIKISNIRETFSFVAISRECYRCADEHKLKMEREREELETRKLITNSSIPGIISTIAGTGSTGYDNYEGPATSADLHFPVGLAMDSNSDIYFADSLNNCIRKIDGTVGTITTVVGSGIQGSSGDGGLARKAKLCHPWGVSIDHFGNIYIADTGNNRIRKISANTNIITTIAGNGIPGYSGDDGLCIHAKIDSPSDLITDSNGNLYFTDTNNNRIRKIDFTQGGIIMTIAGTGGDGYSGDGGSALLAELHRPLGIALDKDENIYVTDSCNHRIRKINSNDSIITTIAGRGDAGFSSDGIYATHTRLNLPWGIAVDSMNNVYFSDSDNHRIRKITAATNLISTVAGTGVEGFSGDREKCKDAQVNAPWGLTLDKRGNLYFADGENHRIRKINLNPVSKWGMAADSSGNIYFGDGDNLLIRKLNITTGKVDLLNNSSSMMSELQNKADFQGPWSVAVDSGGTMWVVDNINDQVQQITPSGEITTLAVAEDALDSKLLLYDSEKDKLLASYETKDIKNDMKSPVLSPSNIRKKLQNASPASQKRNIKSPLFNKSKLNLKLTNDDTESPSISPLTSTEIPLSPSKYGMTVDRDGNIYLANKNNKNILKFCP